MWRIITIFVAIILGVMGLLVFPVPTNTQNVNNDYLRIHIRANSDVSEDQNIKYVVKDAVVNYLTPLLSVGYTKKEAMQIVQDNLSNIKEISDVVLANNGFTYSSQALVTSETFPTRVYQDIVLEGGEYDSLIINLGTGTGNNWWCVVYPPLCFVNVENNNSNFVYKSKLYEIIKAFYGGVN